MENDESSSSTPVETPLAQPVETSQPFTTPLPSPPRPSRYLKFQELSALKLFVTKFDDGFFKSQIIENQPNAYLRNDEKTIELLRDIFLYDQSFLHVVHQVNNHVDRWEMASLHTLVIAAFGRGTGEMNRLIDQYENVQNQYLQRRLEFMTVKDLAEALPFLNSMHS